MPIIKHNCRYIFTNAQIAPNSSRYLSKSTRMPRMNEKKRRKKRKQIVQIIRQMRDRKIMWPKKKSYRAAQTVSWQSVENHNRNNNNNVCASNGLSKSRFYRSPTDRVV